MQHSKPRSSQIMPFSNCKYDLLSRRSSSNFPLPLSPATTINIPSLVMQLNVSDQWYETIQTPQCTSSVPLAATSCAKPSSMSGDGEGELGVTQPEDGKERRELSVLLDRLDGKDSTAEAAAYFPNQTKKIIALWLVLLKNWTEYFAMHGTSSWCTWTPLILKKYMTTIMAKTM